MCGLLDFYLDRFARLNDPHEPLLLLAVLRLIEKGCISRNFIELTVELFDTFNYYWALVMPPDHRGEISLPFLTLSASGFWHLRPRKETAPCKNSDIHSYPELKKMYFGAQLDENLFPLLIMKVSRKKLRTVLLQSYFAPENHGMLIDKGAYGGNRNSDC
jgi:predicted restriction endonuclease